MSEAKPFLPRIEHFTDCTGAQRSFELFQGPQSDGVLIKAREIDPPHAPGYEFSAWSATMGDALGKLRRKIRNGISRRYLAEDKDRGLVMLTGTLRGIVDSNGLNVDGRTLTFAQLQSELSSVDGWAIEIRIADPSD